MATDLMRKTKINLSVEYLLIGNGYADRHREMIMREITSRILEGNRNRTIYQSEETNLKG
jgi:uncharacterized membrane-anchored protein